MKFVTGPWQLFSRNVTRYASWAFWLIGLMLIVSAIGFALRTYFIGITPGILEGVPNEVAWIWLVVSQAPYTTACAFALLGVILFSLSAIYRMTAIRITNEVVLGQMARAMAFANHNLIQNISYTLERFDERIETSEELNAAIKGFIGETHAIWEEAEKLSREARTKIDMRRIKRLEVLTYDLEDQHAQKEATLAEMRNIIRPLQASLTAARVKNDDLRAQEKEIAEAMIKLHLLLRQLGIEFTPPPQSNVVGMKSDDK